VGELGGGDERGVLNADFVVQLVAFAQSAEDRDGILNVRFIDQHRLKTALEGGVFLDVLAVFVQCGSPDAMEFAPRQHRFEHVPGVHGAFGLAGADDGVDLVDEEDDLAFSAGHFL